MAKTTVSAMITKMKRRYDYNITDDDVDNLLVDAMNDSLKSIYQWLFDAGLYWDISSTDELTTVADQPYIDISTSLAATDGIVRVSEQTNNQTIMMIPYSAFRELYVKASLNTASTPNHCAIWNNRLYLGPTPTGAITIYVENVTIPVDVTKTDTLPYKTKYDPLLLAASRVEFLSFIDNTNTTGIANAISQRDRLKKDLIVSATRGVNMNRQSKSRKSGIVGPRKQLDAAQWGFGTGGYGAGGFGTGL